MTAPHRHEPQPVEDRVNRPKDFEAIAYSQAATLRRQAERVQTLIREREAALSDREAALDLAEQYARKAGVDTDRDAVLRYVGEYWAQRGQFEKTWTHLEGQRWEVLAVARQLSELVGGKQVTDLDVKGFAGHVAEHLTAVATAQQARRCVEMFARPPAPATPAGQPSLFEEAS